jgi:hypothetical protein
LTNIYRGDTGAHGEPENLRRKARKRFPPLSVPPRFAL